MANTSPTVVAQYPFDPTGQAASNLIPNEQQVLKPPASNGNWSDYYFILPNATPFFAESLQMTLQPSGKILQEGVDYICTHRFYDATIQCASPVYGSISFMDKTLSGIVRMSYQTLGGDWTLNATQIAQVLANTALDPRTTTWEEVVDLPYQFPPVKHQWDLVDMTGAADVVEAINNIVTALQNSGDQGLARHLADYNNPHHTTAAQVGLGLVSNYAMATNADAQTGSSTSLYMSPATTNAAIAFQALVPLNAHINSQSNPHNTTKAQVGLGSVNNFGWASTTDAQGGTAVNGYMNAQLTAAAITAQALTPLNAHTGNLNNPHQVNATQVGLGDVPNYPMATLNEALAGTATDRFMSPSLVAAVMQGNLGGSLQAHINDHNNPHQVTALQVGLDQVPNYPMATNAQAVAGTITNAFMNPATTLASIQNQITPFAAHVANTSNPHNTTAAQVGLGLVNNFDWASLADAQTGTAVNGYMNAQLTAAAIAAQVGNAFTAHAANTSNPHNVTAAQTGAYTTAQSDTNLTNGLATKLDATGTAADSNKLQGQTVNDIVTLAQQSFTGRINYRFPAVTTASPPPGAQLWTEFTTIAVPGSPDPANPVRDLVLYVIGGEALGDTNPPPMVKVSINLRPATPTIDMVQYAGTPETISFALTFDVPTNTFGLWMLSAPSRASGTVVVLSDPGANWTNAIVTQLTDPTDLITTNNTTYLDDPSSAYAELSGGEVPMQQSFYGSVIPSAHPGRPSNQRVGAGVVQFLNVALNSTDETDAKAIQMPFSTEWRSFDRLSSYGAEPIHASNRAVWDWDNTNSLIRVNNTAGAYLDTLLSMEPWLPGTGSFGLEVELGSTNVNDQSIGVCVGHFLLDGKAYGLWVMRTPGGTVADATAGTIPGAAGFGLFTVGLNLFQNDGKVLAATNTGLTWGDGVLDSNRGSTPYVPESQTAGTNGWASKGKVRIRVTFDGSTFTFETTDFGSTTYVNAAKITVNLNTDQAASILSTWVFYGGPKWGLAAWHQPNSGFNILGCPDFYARYFKYQPQVDGTDTSYIGYYTGDPTVNSGWAVQAYTNNVLVPGRMVYSEMSEQFYLIRRDCTLQPLPVVGSSLAGRQILTT